MSSSNSIKSSSDDDDSSEVSGATSPSSPSTESSSSSSSFYEGTEKLLEVWFTTSTKKLNVAGAGKASNAADTQLQVSQPDLRKIHYKEWEQLLTYARCEILSFRRTEHLDGFVLSESSMFVYSDHIIIKTCGQTTLLNTIEPLLYLAKTFAGFDEILDVFYSRKSFMRPELQDKMHSSFDSEIEILDSEFEFGSAYCLGQMNRECWYLYTLQPQSNARGILRADQTFELIMTDLDESVMSIFTRRVSSTARAATQKAGIDKLFNNMLVDDFLFKPCGYSMNGFLRTGHYVTIHVTPELDFSYVSFETNAPLATYTELMNKVLRMFKPAKFMMTVFANEAAKRAHGTHGDPITGCSIQQQQHYGSNGMTAPAEAASIDGVSDAGKKAALKSSYAAASLAAGYLPEETQFNRFKNYELTFGNYSREAG